MKNRQKILLIVLWLMKPDDTEPYADALVADSNSEITAEETSDSTVEYANETTTCTNDGESGVEETE